MHWRALHGGGTAGPRLVCVLALLLCTQTWAQPRPASRSAAPAEHGLVGPHHHTHKPHDSHSGWSNSSSDAAAAEAPPLRVQLTDQRQNCSAPATPANLCYGGPRVGKFGEVLAGAVPGTVALTFDDGPAGEHTATILDVLDRYGWKATFFLMGRKLGHGVRLIQRMLDGGHQVAAHSFYHDLMLQAGTADAQADLALWEAMFLALNVSLPREPAAAAAAGGFATAAAAAAAPDATQGRVTGFIPAYFRVPYGAASEEAHAVIKAYGYTPVLWSFAAVDWALPGQPPPPPLLSHYTARLGEAGSAASAAVRARDLTLITLQHDLQHSTAASMGELAAYLNATLAARGTRFVTVAEAMGPGAAPPYRPAPRREEVHDDPDPGCAKGYVGESMGAKVCCPRSCGSCEDDGCWSRLGGATHCCAIHIATSFVSCTQHRAPCIISAP